MGLILILLGVGLGVVSSVMVYAYGEHQQALLVRMGIPGAVLLALAVGALIVWGRVLETGPD
jgi:hypothetical protein